MFAIGDRVVYPMYGAGVIEDIEKKEIDGEFKSYYVLRIPIGDLKLTVSMQKAEQSGLREVCSAKEVLSIVDGAGTIDMNDNWNVRYKENLALLKTGDLLKIVEIFKTFVYKERVKALSSAEKKMMGTAKQIILSEIIMSKDVNRSEAENILMSGVSLTA